MVPSIFQRHKHYLSEDSEGIYLTTAAMLIRMMIPIITIINGLQRMDGRNNRRFLIFSLVFLCVSFVTVALVLAKVCVCNMEYETVCVPFFLHIR